ncbi:MAG: hypothetical protein WD035_11200, partial [Balneolaceae bacterium]
MKKVFLNSFIKKSCRLLNQTAAYLNNLQRITQASKKPCVSDYTVLVARILHELIVPLHLFDRDRSKVMAVAPVS